MARRKALTLLLITMLGLMSFHYSHASAEEYRFEGELGLTGMLTHVNGNEAKFNEYRDLRDGLYPEGSLTYDSERYFLDLGASDVGYDTQHYSIEGGKWGFFKYSLEYQEIPHNRTFGAKTFYSGAGSDNLKGIPNSDIKSWSSFDYSVERKTYGGGFKLEMLRPFFFDISASREERDGVRPTAAEGGIGFGNTIELPEPVDYTTDSLKVEGGYAKKPLFLSLGLLYSNFDNNNTNLYFNNAFIDGNPRDALTLPPGNDYYKVYSRNAFKLPMNSKFNVNFGYSRTKSETTLLDSYYGNGVLNTISLSDPVFDGRIDTLDYDLSLTSNPVSFLDAKVFYKYHKRENKSDDIITQDGDLTLSSRLIDIKKESYGMELGFRLPSRLYLTTAYGHVNKDRNREDVPKNNIDVYSVALRWNGLEYLAVSAGYERSRRGADFHFPGVPPDDPEYMERFIKRFDVAPADRDIYKVSVDLYPLENLNLSLAYRNITTDYTDTILGLRDAKSHEFSIDGDYTVARIVKLAGYFDYEKTRYFQVQRSLPFDATSGFDPRTPPTTSAYNWDAAERDKSYDYGICAEIHAIEKKLTFRIQHDYVKSDGFVDYTYLLGGNPLPAGRTQDNIDLSDWDDYRLRMYMVKAVYRVTRKISVSAGYAYQDFHYNDARLDGYQYIPATPFATYLTGAYKDQSYVANIAFLSAVYRF